MSGDGVLLLGRSEIDRLLTIPECIAAVEEMFRLQGAGKFAVPGILGLHASAGGLHIKAALLPGLRNYFVAKLNTNFPGNRASTNLPTIQGLIVLCDGENGIPLAVLDSIDITIKRTAAASAVAAKYLACRDSAVATICGCGSQALAQLRALQTVLPLEKIYAFDLREDAARHFAAEAGPESQCEIEVVTDLSRALSESDVCLTCTTAERFFIRKEDVRPGTFITAVGADNPHKQEIDPALMASAKVVADSLEQCCTIGDTHHAIAAGLMAREDVHAELSEIVAGHKVGRATGEEIIVFDSSGIALEDAVAAVAVYEKARQIETGARFEFAA